jgi:hypothetical protein
MMTCRPLYDPHSGLVHTLWETIGIAQVGHFVTFGAFSAWCDLFLSRRARE